MKVFLVLVLVAVALATPRRPNHFKGRKNFPWPDGRIVGGRDADITEFPHQVSLQWYDYHTCGGSIISEKFVVTAAHCTDGSSADELLVRVNTSIVEQGGILIQVAKIHQNPAFNDVLENDVSVLELAEAIPLGPGAQPIALPDSTDKVATGTVVTVSGWGVLNYGDYDLPSQLQAVDVNVVDHDECAADYEGVFWGVSITETMLCASVPEGGKDACQGDSGGPLVADGKLYGIVSWGNECALAKYPGVYTDVSAVRDFIKEVSGI